MKNSKHGSAPAQTAARRAVFKKCKGNRLGGAHSRGQWDDVGTIYKGKAKADYGLITEDWEVFGVLDPLHNYTTDLLMSLASHERLMTNIIQKLDAGHPAFFHSSDNGIGNHALLILRYDGWNILTNNVFINDPSGAHFSDPTSHRLCAVKVAWDGFFNSVDQVFWWPNGYMITRDGPLSPRRKFHQSYF